MDTGEPLPGHDNLCSNPTMLGVWCVDCCRLMSMRQDERLQTIEQIRQLPVDATRDEILDTLEPMGGDPLRRPISLFAYPPPEYLPSEVFLDDRVDDRGVDANGGLGPHSG
jgi:hypothetical protein